jgi:hypothetical protein
MSDVTTRLVTLQPPGAALDGLLDALRTARSRAGAATTVGRDSGIPRLPGQPDGYTVIDFTTSAAPGGRREHDRFILAAGKALNAHGVSYAWRHAAGEWHHAGRGGAT